MLCASSCSPPSSVSKATRQMRVAWRFWASWSLWRSQWAGFLSWNVPLLGYRWAPAAWGGPLVWGGPPRCGVGYLTACRCAAVLQRSHRVYCVRLAQLLVDDYCSLVPGSVSTLQNIHGASPRFCCQFLTAVTALYDLGSGDLSRPVGSHRASRAFFSQCPSFRVSLCGGGGVLSEELTPPTELLQMIVSWIQEDLRLVLVTFLNTPLSGSQPISSLDVTPLGGLVRWCVKAPLAYRRDRKLASPNGTAESETDVGPLFSALHLGVLQVRGADVFHLDPGRGGERSSPPVYRVGLCPPPGLHASAEHSEREGALWSPGAPPDRLPGHAGVRPFQAVGSG